MFVVNLNRMRKEYSQVVVYYRMIQRRHEEFECGISVDLEYSSITVYIAYICQHPWYRRSSDITRYHLGADETFYVNYGEALNTSIIFCANIRHHVTEAITWYAQTLKDQLLNYRRLLR